MLGQKCERRQEVKLVQKLTETEIVCELLLGVSVTTAEVEVEGQTGGHRQGPT